MTEGQDFAVIQLPVLKWPTTLGLPAKRFRLFVAANVKDTSTDVLSDFASAALSNGMVYFCAWGRDCERFHDIVDEVVVEDDLDERRFSGPTASDVVMTTWHEDENLEEALDFFVTCAVPTDGFAADSDFRLVICVEAAEWTQRAKRFLRSASFS